VDIRPIYEYKFGFWDKGHYFYMLGGKWRWGGS